MSRKMIYVMQRSDGIVKVGISGNVNGRVACLKVESKMDIVVLYQSEYVDNPRYVESAIHKCLSCFNIIGEWFNCTPDIAIESCGNMVKNLGDLSELQFSEESIDPSISDGKCKYRNCDKELPEQVGAGRKRVFCLGGKCKRMEQYYKNLDRKVSDSE